MGQQGRLDLRVLMVLLDRLVLLVLLVQLDLLGLTARTEVTARPQALEHQLLRPDLLVSQQAGRTLLRYSHSVFLKERLVRLDLLVLMVQTGLMARRLDLEHLLQAQDQLG